LVQPVTGFHVASVHSIALFSAIAASRLTNHEGHIALKMFPNSSASQSVSSFGTDRLVVRGRAGASLVWDAGAPGRIHAGRVATRFPPQLLHRSRWPGLGTSTVPGARPH
jgi:hypothetical protein